MENNFAQAFAGFLVILGQCRKHDEQTLAGRMCFAPPCHLPLAVSRLQVVQASWHLLQSPSRSAMQPSEQGATALVRYIDYLVRGLRLRETGDTAALLPLPPGERAPGERLDGQCAAVHREGCQAEGVLRKAVDGSAVSTRSTVVGQLASLELDGQFHPGGLLRGCSHYQSAVRLQRQQVVFDRLRPLSSLDRRMAQLKYANEKDFLMLSAS